MFVFFPRLTLHVMIFRYLHPPFSFHLNSSPPPLLNIILDVSFDTLETIYMQSKSIIMEKRKYTKRHKHFPKTDRQGYTRKAKAERIEYDKE